MESNNHLMLLIHCLLPYTLYHIFYFFWCIGSKVGQNECLHIPLFTLSIVYYGVTWLILFLFSRYLDVCMLMLYLSCWILCCFFPTVVELVVLVDVVGVVVPWPVIFFMIPSLMSWISEYFLKIFMMIFWCLLVFSWKCVVVWW